MYRCMIWSVDSYMIRFKNLTRSYGPGKGIFDFSFEVEEGEVFGLLGPSGSGKTTALRMLMGFEEPTKGRCAMNGKDCAKAGLSLRRITGYLPENVRLPQELTGRQFLKSMAQMRGVKNLERLFELAGELKLDVDQRIGKMSSADVKKTGIVCAMQHNPHIVLLDRPFEHLDPKSRSALVDIILEEKERDHMVLLGTEDVNGVDMTCDRVGLLDHGNMVYLGDIEDLRDNMCREYMIQFHDARSAMKFSKEKFEIKTMKDRNLVVEVQGAVKPLLQALSAYDVTEIEPIPTSLKETFQHIYGGRLHA